MPDIITIGVYRREGIEDNINIDIHSNEGQEKIKQGFSGAIRDMHCIKQKFDEAAGVRGQPSPELHISFLLVPNWSMDRGDHGNQLIHYDSPSYAQHKTIYIRLFKEKFSEQLDINLDEDHHVRFVDLLQDARLTDIERHYMENLTALGSNADIIKTRALINNQENKHLQLDSNTKITNYQALYDDTFGNILQVEAYHADMGASRDQDGFNASLYDKFYVSVHNKIVYTVPESLFISELKNIYLEYCKVHMDDEQSKSKNSIYSKIFTVAAAAVKIARIYEVPSSYVSGVTKTIYPAKLEEADVFRLTRHVVTAVNQSWKPNQERPEGFDILSRISGIAFNDTTFDFSCYNVVMKKLHGVLRDHPIEGAPIPGLKTAKKAKDLLISISNIEHEKRAANDFEQHVIMEVSVNNEVSDSEKGAVLHLLFSAVPESEKHAVTQILQADIRQCLKPQLIYLFYQKHAPEYGEFRAALQAFLESDINSVSIEYIFLRIIAESELFDDEKTDLVRNIADSKGSDVQKAIVKKQYEVYLVGYNPPKYSAYAQSGMQVSQILSDPLSEENKQPGDVDPPSPRS